VEIREHSSQGAAKACLFQEKYWDHGKNGAAAINNKIVFFSGIAVSTGGYNTKFDIYDVNNYNWSVGQLPADIGGASIFSYNNTVYVVGGKVNGSVSNQIWKLVF
jgi:N-acetylneuraminic acid mutarotase